MPKKATEKVKGISDIINIGKKVAELVKTVMEYKEKIDDLETRVKALEEKCKGASC